MDFNLKIITLNCRGLTNKPKRCNVFTYLADKKADICFLQETFITKSSVQEFNNNWHGLIFHSLSDSNHSRGVCILIKKELNVDIINVHRSDDGRRLMVNIAIKGENFCLVSAYAPNVVAHRIQFLKRLQKWIKQNCCDEDRIIIGADLNVTDDPRDKSYQGLDKSSPHFTAFKKFLTVDDAFRYKHPTAREYTYIDPSGRGKFSRIDYILTSKTLTKHVKNIAINIAPVPDHKSMHAAISLSDKKRGKNYWKLNSSLLDSDIYKMKIERLICETIDNYNNVLPYKMLWDLLKIKIKEESIIYAVKASKEKRSHSDKLQCQISKLDEELAIDYKEDKFTERQLLKNRLDTVLEERVRGAQIRSRARWVEDGERSTSYFLRLENHRQTYNTIDRLENSEGRKLEKDEDILNEASKFYSSLYKSTMPNVEAIDKYLKETSFKTVLSNADSNVCEGKITLEECTQVVNKLKINKSPGLDGLTAEFYQTFWPNIGQIMVRVYNESFDDEILCTSQRMSVLSLIFKKGDREKLANYRPISITNIDYKIVAFALATRLHKVLDTIISTDQAGYIKKRFIGHNIRLVQDVLEHAEKNKRKGILLFLDFEKAFDSLEWTFMTSALKKFNFGDQFIRWVKTLYKKPKICIKNNGHISEEFEINRGIRQGCPLSALLFIIAIEVLALRVKQNKDLKGYKIRGKESEVEVKLSQYADDGIMFLNDEDQIYKAISIINEFGILSGLKLNRNKSIGLYLGTDKYNRDKVIHGINITEEPQKCLGIYVGYNRKTCDERNWTEKLNNIEILLETWKQRQLTLFGKITILKTLAVPKITHTATNCPAPEGITQKLSRLFHNFLWGKKDRIKRNVLIASIENGGLGMIDVESYILSLKACWVTRILDTNHTASSWNILARALIDSVLPHELIQSLSYNKQEMFPQITKLPVFYQDVIYAYAKSNNITFPSTTAEFLEMNIWGNRHILYENHVRNRSTIYFKSLCDSEILKIKDIRFHEGKVDENYLYGKVRNKCNILQEITVLRRALKPFKHLLLNHEPDDQDGNREIRNSVPSKSKCYYQSLVEQKCEKPKHSLLTANQIIVNSMQKMHTDRTKKMFDPKIAEFNYKVLNNILPCNKNLKVWRIKDNDECPNCRAIQDIVHMLFYCPQAQCIWSAVETSTGINISTDKILTTGDTLNETFLISVICFIIYKSFILERKFSQTSQKEDIFFCWRELQYRLYVYENCKKAVEFLPLLRKAVEGFRRMTVQI